MTFQRSIGPPAYNKLNRICVRDSKIENDKNQELRKPDNHLGDGFQTNAIDSENMAPAERLQPIS